MSVVFSLAISVDQLPPPVDFINLLAPNWMPDDPNVDAPGTMGNTILPICPDLDRYGEKTWAYDRSYMFYLANGSTRGLEVWYRDGEFVVRILTLSSAAEWEFAFQILELAGGENGLLSTDWEPATLRIGELRKEFDDRRIAETLRSQLTTVMNLIDEQREVIALPGPINEFWIGPWLHERILAAYEDPNESLDEILHTVLSLMLIVNYVGMMNVEPVEMEITETADGKSHYAACIKSGKRYFVPVVDSLVIFASTQCRTTILPNDFKDYLGGFFHEPEELFWLDEQQLILGPIDEERLKIFVKSVLAQQRRKSGKMGIHKGKRKK